MIRRWWAFRRRHKHHFRRTLKILASHVPSKAQILPVAPPCERQGVTCGSGDARNLNRSLAGLWEHTHAAAPSTTPTRIQQFTQGVYPDVPTARTDGETAFASGVAFGIAQSFLWTTPTCETHSRYSGGRLGNAALVPLACDRDDLHMTAYQFPIQLSGPARASHLTGSHTSITSSHQQTFRVV